MAAQDLMVSPEVGSWRAHAREGSGYDLEQPELGEDTTESGTHTGKGGRESQSGA